MLWQGELRKHLHEVPDTLKNLEGKMRALGHTGKTPELDQSPVSKSRATFSKGESSKLRVSEPNPTGPLDSVQISFIRVHSRLNRFRNSGRLRLVQTGALETRSYHGG